ncbi:MAG: 30S ribosomal protein S6 [Rhodobiaceae bacterium]|nr:30S ribosomal protein S6 [Rhodobiaceae bacterium]
MPLYEHVFLARQDVSAQQVETLTEQMTGVITDNGGSVGKKEYWGLRPLSFRIKKNRKAHYQLIDIDAPPAAVAEMERQMSLNEDILRFMTIKVEEHTDQPSAILTRRDRDDRRGGRGDRPDRGDRGPRGDRGDRGGDSRPRRDDNDSSED